MTKEKNDKSIFENALKSVSYGAGIFAGKIAKIGKVTETEQWKEMVSKAGDVYEKVGDKAKEAMGKIQKTVKASVDDMKGSFDEGVNSLVEDAVEKDREEDKGSDEKAAEGGKLKVKAKTKIKVKGGKKKIKRKISSEKEIPVDSKLDKEIEEMTKDVISE